MSSDWVADSVIGFLGSPLWRVPTQTFVENNCIVFDTEEEHKLEYTVIHMKYKELVESLLEHFLADLEIAPAQFAEIMATDFDVPQSTKGFMRDAAQAISAAEDYLLFRSLMTEQNLKLEAEVLQQAQSEIAARSSNHYLEVTPPEQNIEPVAEPPPAYAAVEPPDSSTAHAPSSSDPSSHDAALEEAIRLSKEEYEKSKQLKKFVDGFDPDELARALEASRLDYERVQARLKTQSIATERALQTSLKGAPKLNKLKASKKKNTSTSKGTKERISVDPPRELPPLANTLHVATSGERWVSEAATKAVARIGPSSNTNSYMDVPTNEKMGETAEQPAPPNEVLSREEHFKMLRERLRMKNNEKRNSELEEYAKQEQGKRASLIGSGDASIQPQPPKPSTSSSDGPKLRAALALRLKQEVIKKS